VTFCAYPVFPEWPDFVSRFSLRRPSGEQVSDQINMVVVEMSKLNDRLKKSAENLSWLEAWSLFFNFADNPAYRGLINNLITEKKEINMATELLMEISQDERERAIMRSRRMYETDRFNEMQTAIDRSLAKGKAESVERMYSLLSQGYSPLDAMNMIKTSNS
jgi:hypothetical protein